MVQVTGELEKPSWLKVRMPSGSRFEAVRGILRDNQVRTVCDSSHCPNISDCWSCGTATFMILGEVCTRSCRFCAVTHGDPNGQVDLSEAERVARAVKQLHLTHVVVTSVTRDDLQDGGAGAFVRTVRAVRELSPGTSIELLIPDMRGDLEALRRIVGSGPEVLGHNLEVVPRLQTSVRDRNASYEGSLQVLRVIKQLNARMMTKTSLMLGLGETKEEVLDTLLEAREAEVDLVTLGQYLRPRGCDLAVKRYVAPEEFQELRQKAMSMGFRQVMAGPLVRSSYHAQELIRRSEEMTC